MKKSVEHGQNLSYCGLVDARISASEKDLPVLPIYFCLTNEKNFQHLMNEKVFPSYSFIMIFSFIMIYSFISQFIVIIQY